MVARKMGLRQFRVRAHGDVARLAMLSTQYRQPMNWTVKGLQDRGVLDGQLRRTAKA